jgi:peptidoglycan/xylan/chitin deacetylase (PgdA/CDA1 family)
MSGTFARGLLGAVGAVAAPVCLGLQRGREAGVVLLYHRVSHDRDPAYPPLNPTTFRTHCEIIRARYEVLPLGVFVERLTAGKSLKGCAALTFDDGYADFLDEAYPVLEALGLPATHFLVSDCVTSGKPTWNLRVNHLAARRFADAGEALREARRVGQMLSAFDAAHRYAWLDEAEAESGTAWPRMLSQADLAQVSPELVEWGSQTLSHAMLNQRPQTEAREELAGSRAEIERMTGRPVRYLAYPNGAYDCATVELAQACGYAAAFTVGQAEVAAGARFRAGAGLFEIPRFDVSDLPASMLVMESTGTVEGLRKLVRR